MEHGILPNLDKSYILTHVSQERIFEHYLGVSIETDGLFKAPAALRAGDKNPTCSFYYNNQGRLRLRDWAGYFWGDCFDLVGYITHVDSKSKKGFNVILDTIARDFRIHKYSNQPFIETGNTYSINDVSTKVKRKTSIQFKPRNWVKQDADFWKAGNITKKILEEYRVYPCLYIWINNNLIYNFLPKDPAYAYYFSPTDIKIYFPNRKEGRFLTNTTYLQGLDLLEPDEIGIITKSYKDVMSLRSFGIQSVAPGAESILITKDQWSSLKWTCNHWFSLMDYDRQGVTMANKLRKTYGIPPLFFKGKKSSTGIKDFYDHVKLKGVDKTVELIDNTRSLFQDDFDKYNQDMYENLNWLRT